MPSSRNGTRTTHRSRGTTDHGSIEMNSWIQAARPHTLWAAVVPVLVGSGLAAGDGVFRWDAATAAMIASIAIQVAANFANDVFDARKGADTDDRIGPARMVASGAISDHAMWIATWLAVGVGALAAVWLIAIAGWWVAVIGIVATAAMLGYVGGATPYGYRGLGELFVFVFFGVVATVGSRWVHDGSLTLTALLLSIPVGFPVTAILVANNIRDIETDAASGKRTLAVTLGRERTRTLYAALIWGTFFALGMFVIGGLVPVATGIAVFWVPLAVPLISTVKTTTDGPALIGVLKGTARLELFVGVSIAVGASLGP